MNSAIISRKDSIERVNRLRLELSHLQELLAVERTNDETEELEAGLDATNSMLHNAMETYCNTLSVENISRCPFTGEIVKAAIDTQGFGGMWWDYDQPMRTRIDAPPTFCGYTGGAALKELDEPVEHFCKPGATLPFVITEVLKLPGTKAVLSSLEVGKTQVYVLCHFANSRPPEMPCINDLGTRFSTLVMNNREVKLEGIMLEQVELDFELAYWIRIGKLLWVAPGDKKCLLRSDLALCPYLNLPGERAIVRVNRGVISQTLLNRKK